MKNIIIIGAGGHASVIIDIIKSMMEEGQNIVIKGLLDDRSDLIKFMNFKILDEVNNADKYNNDDTEFIIAIGNNEIRKKINDKFSNLKYFKAIHNTSVIGSNVVIEDGTVVMPGAIINANTNIGKHVIINTGTIIEHDNEIEDYAHISPGATLCGGVSIGESTHIGANVTVIPYKKIQSNSIIGAGSTVIDDIESNVLCVGSPAKVIKNIQRG